MGERVDRSDVPTPGGSTQAKPGRSGAIDGVVVSMASYEILMRTTRWPRSVIVSMRYTRVRPFRSGLRTTGEAPCRGAPGAFSRRFGFCEARNPGVPDQHRP